jgi:hypothetical protein
MPRNKKLPLLDRLVGACEQGRVGDCASGDPGPGRGRWM